MADSKNEALKVFDEYIAFSKRRIQRVKRSRGYSKMNKEKILLVEDLELKGVILFRYFFEKHFTDCGG